MEKEVGRSFSNIAVSSGTEPYGVLAELPVDEHLCADPNGEINAEDDGADVDASIEIVGPFKNVLAPSRVHNQQPLKKVMLSSAGSATGMSGNVGQITMARPPFFLDTARTNAAPEITGTDIRKMAKSTRPRTSFPRTSTAAGAGRVEIRHTRTSISLPKYSYKSYTPTPCVVYTRHEEETNDLVGALRGPVSMDIEWRVVFRRGVPERRTAVVQVADAHLILVVQVYGMERFPQKLMELIESKNIIKMGVNILNDGKKLFRDYGILSQNLVELGALAKQADPFTGDGERHKDIVSLAKVVERYCGMRLVKGKERTGNWEAELNQMQIDYAANDAHSGLMVYKKLREIVERNRVILVPEKYTSHIESRIFGLAFEDETAGKKERERGGSASAVTSAAGSTRASRDSAAGSGEMIPGSVMTPAMEMVGVRPQQLRAYRYWHVNGMAVERMCKELSTKADKEPLKVGTVISYVIGALQGDPTLPFQMQRLRKLVQMDGGSWERHRAWILKGRGEKD